MRGGAAGWRGAADDTARQHQRRGRARQRAEDVRDRSDDGRSAEKQRARCAEGGERLARQRRAQRSAVVPAEVLRQEIGARRTDISIGELISLKDRFGVSIQALTYRCKDLECHRQL